MNSIGPSESPSQEPPEGEPSEARRSKAFITRPGQTIPGQTTFHILPSVMSGPSGYFSTSGSSLSPSPSPPAMTTLSDYMSDLSDKPEKNEKLINEAYALKKDYVMWQIQVTKNSAKWDKIYGIIIFFTVVTLVLVGIGFSIAQFVRAMQIGNFQSMSTELAIRSSEIVLSTTLVGGFVLIASLAFFYLFLCYVYKSNLPISDVYTALNSLTDKITK